MSPRHRHHTPRLSLYKNLGRYMHVPPSGRGSGAARRLTPRSVRSRQRGFELTAGLGQSTLCSASNPCPLTYHFVVEGVINGHLLIHYTLKPITATCTTATNRPVAPATRGEHAPPHPPWRAPGPPPWREGTLRCIKKRKTPATAEDQPYVTMPQSERNYDETLEMLNIFCTA